MKVHIKKEVNIPSGLYCGNCRFKKQYKDEESSFNGKNYCNEFYPWLEKDNQGRCLKCEKCLLNIRKNLIAGV